MCLCVCNYRYLSYFVMYSVTNELNTEDCNFDIPAGMRPQIKYCLVLPCLAWPKLASLAGNTFARGIVFT